MDYSAEQREIIRRMGEVSREMDQMAEENRTAQTATARNLIDAVTALTDAMRYSAEMGRLCRQHGDLFREFLDTLL